MMHRSTEISEKNEALSQVKQNATALSGVSPKLKSDISFVWELSRINSQINDELRKKYITKFLIQESLKLFASLATVVVSGFILAGLILLPIPFLAAMIIGSLLAAISGFYAINKIIQHAKGYFKVSENIEASPTTTEENQILQCVAFGQQDEASKLLKRVPTKTQEALRYQGKFTDYSGRTFNCTAYEYAYWAKDIHMCRMLESYMDAETKAFILERITTNDEDGLSYQQNGTAHQSAHFDLTPLKNALNTYVTGSGYDSWFNSSNWRAMDAAWLAVGLAQRDVPAHVAQEYCRTDRSSESCPDFNKASFPRVLSFRHYVWSRTPWFPLPHEGGLGFDFSAVHGGIYPRVLPPWRGAPPLNWRKAPGYDLEAITRLDEVRTAELTQLLEALRPAASQSLSR